MTRAPEGLKGAFRPNGRQSSAQVNKGPWEGLDAGAQTQLEHVHVGARRVTMSVDGMGPQMPSRWFGADG